eukprot:scaffold115064_cov69-Phaeocystis_antarctica.AAC.1
MSGSPPPRSSRSAAHRRARTAWREVRAALPPAAPVAPAAPAVRRATRRQHPPPHPRGVVGTPHRVSRAGRLRRRPSRRRCATRPHRWPASGTRPPRRRARALAAARCAARRCRTTRLCRARRRRPRRNRARRRLR